MKKNSHGELRIGWASTDLTPEKPVLVTGQFHARVSEGVLDPVTATALALEFFQDGKSTDFAVMVSCEFVTIPDGLRDAVRVRLEKILPEIDPMRVFLNATHTHTAPEVRVETRFKIQQSQPKLPVEIHILRLGDIAFATNPFEYYVDYGMQIKARSKAAQTFLVQHAGLGTYLPTARAISGKSYGAVPASTPIGPEGGRELAQKTVEIINSLWDSKLIR